MQPLHSGHPWIRDHGVAPDRPLDTAVLSRIKQFSAMNKLKKMALRVSSILLKLKFLIACFGSMSLQGGYFWRLALQETLVRSVRIGLHMHSLPVVDFLNDLVHEIVLCCSIGSVQAIYDFYWAVCDLLIKGLPDWIILH